MSHAEFAVEVAEDVDRIFDHMQAHEVEDPPSRIQDIIAAISVLERNPLIGRLVAGTMRELVIGRHANGYVALYRYVPALDIAFILTIRSQRQAGYRDGAA